MAELGCLRAEDELVFSFHAGALCAGPQHTCWQCVVPKHPCAPCAGTQGATLCLSFHSPLLMPTHTCCLADLFAVLQEYSAVYVASQGLEQLLELMANDGDTRPLVVTSRDRLDIVMGLLASQVRIFSLACTCAHSCCAEQFLRMLIVS